MDWTDSLDNPRALTSMYDQAPQLQQVRLLGATLDQDGPRLQLRLDLNQFPQRPPRKWQGQGFNTVQLKLDLFGVEQLQLGGWGTDNVVDLELERRPDGVAVSATAAGFKLSCRCLMVRVAGVSGYLQRDDTP